MMKTIAACYYNGGLKRKIINSLFIIILFFLGILYSIMYISLIKLNLYGRLFTLLVQYFRRECSLRRLSLCIESDSSFSLKGNW